MPNILKNLEKKEKAIQEQVQQEKERHQRKMYDLNLDLNILRRAREKVEYAAEDLVCPRCKGTGEEVTGTDAAGQTERGRCPLCEGTGINLGGA